MPCSKTLAVRSLNLVITDQFAKVSSANLLFYLDFLLYKDSICQCIFCQTYFGQPICQSFYCQRVIPFGSTFFVNKKGTLVKILNDPLTPINRLCSTSHYLIRNYYCCVS